MPEMLMSQTNDFNGALAQAEINRLLVENERLRTLLKRANEELDEMTYLDCPEFVERDEELSGDIEAALKNSPLNK